MQTNSYVTMKRLFSVLSLKASFKSITWWPCEGKPAKTGEKPDPWGEPRISLGCSPARELAHQTLLWRAPAVWWLGPKATSNQGPSEVWASQPPFLSMRSGNLQGLETSAQRMLGTGMEWMRGSAKLPAKGPLHASLVWRHCPHSLPWDNSQFWGSPHVQPSLHRGGGCWRDTSLPLPMWVGQCSW